MTRMTRILIYTCPSSFCHAELVSASVYWSLQILKQVQDDHAAHGLTRLRPSPFSHADHTPVLHPFGMLNLIQHLSIGFFQNLNQRSTPEGAKVKQGYSLCSSKILFDFLIEVWSA